MDNDRLILIIEDNVTNGLNLSTLCRKLAPDWQVTWIQVYHKAASKLPEKLLPEGLKYITNITTQEKAKEAILAETSGLTNLIVFYDLQLGLVQRNSEMACSSPITTTLQTIIEEPRKTLFDIHSVDLNTRQVAITIDESLTKVLHHHWVTGRPIDEVEGIVKETIDKWKDLYQHARVSNG